MKRKMETNIAEIPLTQGCHAIVDNENISLLNTHRWYTSSRASKGETRYAKRKEKGKTVLMHREIMNAPAGMQIDHINGNGLDNRKANLRLCNYSQNQQNQRKKTRSTSRYKGVSKDKKKWAARICINGKKIWIGRYHDEIRAAKAYDQKAIELFGEFANINFPSQKTKLISEKNNMKIQENCAEV